MHWAYRKPVRPQPPATRLTGWARNPIDAFVLARLEKEGLAPAPEAAREVLLRRLHLDLVGLPPTREEVDAFVRDRRPDAYERQVERLLASPHHGEKWARQWLDLARYADSNGYEKDRPRVAWKWRDWVIGALNRNLSFKQFTIEQLAGDMLPNATEDQRIATGFHRNTLLNQEGGVDDEEARWETLVDRVGTTATVWLGSTIACAQCHNHKYDPFSQKDFYRLLAFFDNGSYKINGQHPESHVFEPELDLPTPAQAAARAKLAAEIAKLEPRLDPFTDDNRDGLAAWEAAVRRAEEAWAPLRILRVTSRGGATLKVLPDGSVLASGKNPDADEYEIEAEGGPAEITGFRLEALADARLPGGGPGRAPDGNFFLTAFAVRAQGEEKEEVVELGGALADEHVSGHRAETVVAGGESAGWAIDAGARPQPARRQAVFVPKAPVTARRLFIRLAHAMPRTARNLGRFRLSVSTRPEPTLVASVPTRLRPLLSMPVAQRPKEQHAELARLYVRIAPSLRPVHEEIASLRKKIEGLGIATAMILEERRTFERPFTHLRVRGAFTSVGEKIWAGTPKALPPMPESAPANRLGLAMWLTDDEHPLTARVTANRIWAEYFGRGLVETAEDFGTQGSPPTHPELLDWLATEFVRTGWDLKALHRIIVGSATYRQSARTTRALLDRDPYNKLYARGPRFRLEAETIRDVALAASGLLSRKIGGPSVYPVQPEGIWDQPYSGLRWTTSEGADRHRRALYTFIRRTSPYPMLTTFDAPSREVCTARRVRTNTPLQALTTLNDPAFFEAAQALARRMMREGGGHAEGRAERGFRLVTGRRPSKQELAAIVASHRVHLADFARDAAGARAVAGGASAELAAWTMVANSLLNLDEAVTKE